MSRSYLTATRLEVEIVAPDAEPAAEAAGPNPRSARSGDAGGKFGLDDLVGASQFTSPSNRQM
jgi:hypothetical protein